MLAALARLLAPIIVMTIVVAIASSSEQTGLAQRFVVAELIRLIEYTLPKNLLRQQENRRHI